METLPVLFRVIGGEVLALFPTVPEQCGSDHMVESYAHVGQHGAASVELTRLGRRATPAEYAPLLRELRAIYERALAPGDTRYRLRVMERFNRRAYQAARAQLHADGHAQR